MNAAYDTTVKRFIREFVAEWPNAAINRFAFAHVIIVGKLLIIINSRGLVRRRHGPIVHLINAIHIDIVAGATAAAIVCIMMIIFVSVIVNGAISAVQVLIDVIQFAD